MPWIRFAFVLTLLIAGAALATRGASNRVASLDSLTELWSDTLRDTDQIGMRVTRVSDAEEMKTGAELARSAVEFAPGSMADQEYVSAVGEILVRRVSRPGIWYQFHVVETPEINAFALPGGQIFVTSGMLTFVRSESELASILGHEISHVDLRHCIERYQYEIQFKRLGAPEAGQLAELFHRLATFPFAQYEEEDADAEGERLAVESGYDPFAAPALMTRFEERMGESSRTPAATPAGEAAQAAVETLQSFFRSHPPTEVRVSKLQADAETAQSRLRGHTVYVGQQNLRDRTPKSALEYANEYRNIE